MHVDMGGRATWALLVFLFIQAPSVWGVDYYKDDPITTAIIDVVNYAESHWNCKEPDCQGMRVANGSKTGQELFRCAEFVAHSLAAGRLIPGIDVNAPQKD
jgi:hypothetical protein